MYDKFKDFSNLLDQIDSHCFTGDTLYSADARKELANYLGRWERSIKSHEEIEAEIEAEAKAEAKAEIEAEMEMEMEAENYNT